MKKTVQLLILAACLLILLYGIFHERHEVRSIGNNESKEITGPALVEASAYDGLMLKEDALYDVYSLKPAAVQAVEQEKDCFT